MPRFDHLVVLAKIETTYGTDATPTAAANAILLQAVETTPLETDQVQRPKLLPYDAAQEVLHTASRMTLTGTFEAAGAGAAGTVPGYGPLLRACGLAETITATTKVDYSPVTRGHESASLWHYQDSALHKGLGARGTLNFTLAARGIPTFRVAMTGLYVPGSAVALPTTASYTAFQAPEIADDEHTPTFRIGGQDEVLQNLTFEQGGNVRVRDLVGKKEVRLSGRAPRLTAVIEAPDDLARDYFAMAAARTTVPVSLVHGTAAGRIIELSGQRAQIMPPSIQNDDGIQMLSIPMVLLPTNGDDEFRFTVR